MNEQKWRLKGTQIVGQVGTNYPHDTKRFYPDGWMAGCWMIVSSDMLEPANMPVAALEAGLTKESTIFDVWRRAHMNMQDRSLAAIKDRLDALEAKPAPEPYRPLEVGDEVWVKGTLTEIDHTSSPYRIDFGHDDLLWLYKDATIKRADQPTRAERIAKLDDLIDVIKRA